MQFVNELLAGEAYAQIVKVGYIPKAYGYQTVQYGDANLHPQSWATLKTRLINNGFIIRQTNFDKRGRRSISMSFSV